MAQELGLAGIVLRHCASLADIFATIPVCHDDVVGSCSLGVAALFTF